MERHVIDDLTDAAAGPGAANPVSPAPADLRRHAHRQPVCPRGVTTRRQWLKVAWGSLLAAGATVVGASARFLYPNALVEPPQVFAVGRPEDYAPGVDTRWQERFGVLVVREPGRLYALFAECTHLGCQVNWFASERRFKCPCHGSGFRADGANVEGPAPRPLDRAAVFVSEDGRLVVDKSRRFTWEQRERPEAFVAV